MFEPTQLLEKHGDTFVCNRQIVVERCLDELPISCSQAEKLLERTTEAEKKGVTTWSWYISTTITF